MTMVAASDIFGLMAGVIKQYSQDEPVNSGQITFSQCQDDAGVFTADLEKISFEP